MVRILSALILSCLAAACSEKQPTAPPVPLPTDTTSHEVEWSVTTIGDAQTTLLQLFSVGDSTVYALGEIYKRDSTGKLESSPYNAARWNGRTWELLRIPVLLCSTTRTFPMTLWAGFAFSEMRTHFFAAGELVERTEGGYRYDCDLELMTRGTIENVFAYSNEDYYLIGLNSTIIHWDGNSFTREETGTHWETKDIFGNATDLWAVAGTPSDHKGGVLYKPRNGNWVPIDSLSDGGTRSVNSVWCDKRAYSDGGFVILAGAGIWYRDTTWKRPPKSITDLGRGDLYFSAVRGRCANDIFAVGDFDIVTHFNGKTWRLYTELLKYPGGGILCSIAFAGRDVFIAGVYADGKGRIYRGRRE